MGGGHLTRPGFDAPQCDPDDPLTEFYLILQKALGETGRFALPGAYIAFRPSLERQLYEEDMPDCCTLFSAPGGGRREVFAPAQLLLLYDELSIAPDTRPSGLILTEESSRRTTAVQLLPPFLAPGAVPCLPDSRAALTLQLSADDLLLADTNPDALGRALCRRTEGKCWVRHPAIDQWMVKALSAAQRDYRRRHSPW